MPLSPETARLTAFVGGLAVFYLVEAIFSCRPWHAARSKRLAFNGSVAVFNTIVMRLTIVAPLVFLAQHVHQNQWGLVPLVGLTGVWEVIASVVVLDMVDYWWHRLNHRIPFLWRFHQVHHVDTHLDVSTSLRFHTGELLLSGLAKASWIVLWGPSLWGFAIFELMISLAAQYHHSNVDFPDRIEAVVRAINVTPRMHASHHSAVTPTLNSNFSTIFSVWDRMFGTFCRPAFEDLQVMGLPYGRERDLKFSYLLAMPFRSRRTIEADSGAGLPAADSSEASRELPRLGADER